MIGVDQFNPLPPASKQSIAYSVVLGGFQCSNPEEKIYADWDCPQATVVHAYAASQEDELSLEKGDLINILRKMPDGTDFLRFLLHANSLIID